MIMVLNCVLVLMSSGALAGNEWRMQVHSGALWRIEQLVLGLEEAIRKDVKEMQKSMEDFKRHNVTTSNVEHQEIKVMKTELYGFHA